MREPIAPRPPSFALLVQQFFTEYLVAQRALSPRTVSSYRDALMLFLDFAHQHLGKSPTMLRLTISNPILSWRSSITWSSSDKTRYVAAT
jgi:site-specific recombinase XerD